MGQRWRWGRRHRASAATSCLTCAVCLSLYSVYRMLILSLSRSRSLPYSSSVRTEKSKMLRDELGDISRSASSRPSGLSRGQICLSLLITSKTFCGSEYTHIAIFKFVSTWAPYSAALPADRGENEDDVADRTFQTHAPPRSASTGRVDVRRSPSKTERPRDSTHFTSNRPRTGGLPFLGTHMRNVQVAGSPHTHRSGA